jgi:hypothetical protein
MPRVPKEPQSWREAEAESAARELRQSLDVAKAKMKEHLEQARAAGFTAADEAAPDA